jgi:hypothetical protein
VGTELPQKQKEDRVNDELTQAMDDAYLGLSQAQAALEFLITRAKGTTLEPKIPALMSARAKVRKAREAVSSTQDEEEVAA